MNSFPVSTESHPTNLIFFNDIGSSTCSGKLRPLETLTNEPLCPAWGFLAVNPRHPNPLLQNEADGGKGGGSRGGAKDGGWLSSSATGGGVVNVEKNWKDKDW